MDNHPETTADSTIQQSSGDDSGVSPLIYSAVSSKILAPNSNYTIDLFVEKNPLLSSSDSALSFSAKLNSLSETFNAGEVSVRAGKSGRLIFHIDDLAEARYNLTLKIKDLGTGKEFENITSIFASKKDRSTLVHTDKAIYKPGETVKFRVVVLDRHLKPFAQDQAVEVKILDSERNVIKLWEKARVKNGLFKSRLELSQEPVLGDWKVEVKSVKIVSDKKKKALDITTSRPASTSELEDLSLTPPEDSDGDSEYDDFDGDASSNPQAQVTQLSFSVDKYVLPKFKVDLKLPPFITYNTTKVPVTVEAKYTYGKGVKGEVILTPKLPYYWRSDGREQPITLTTLPIDETGSGSTDIEIKHLFDQDFYETDVEFVASFTENVTGKQVNTTARVHMYKLPYKIQSYQKSDSFKPGLPFSVTFKVTTQDDIPISDPAPDALQITHGFSYNIEGSTMNSSIPANGTITLTFNTPTNELLTVNNVEVKYKELTHSYWVPPKVQSSSKTYLNVEILNEKDRNDGSAGTKETIVTVGSGVKVEVNCTKEFRSLNYIVFGRARVLSAGKVDLPAPTREHQFDLRILDSHRPSATVVVYVVLDQRLNNEVIADSVKFQVAEGPSVDSVNEVDSTNTNVVFKQNFLNISLSEETREPGSNLTLHIRSDKHSIVALRGVDQSVLLLKEDNDINQKSIDREISYRNDEAINTHRVWGGSSSFQVFEQAGIIILTNGGLEFERRAHWPRPGLRMKTKYSAMAMESDFAPMAFAAPMAAKRVSANAMGAHMRTGSAGGGAGVEIRVRSEFPETWLWEEVNMNDSNTFDLTKKVPDTLTSWIITGYSLNKESGIGALYQPQKLTVFRPFFVSLNLPYSVVKGEVLSLQVLVHNYMRDASGNGKEITAEITLDNADGKFHFVEESLKDAKTATRRVTCKPNSVTSTNFIISLNVFGQVPLNVKGVTLDGLAGDAVSRQLKVIPPGEKQRRSVATLLSVPSGENLEPTAVLKANFPKDRVAGADKLKLTFIADLLGSTIENLDKLIQMPTGCGEQNMLNFVADIVVLNYLESSKSLRSQVKSKAIKYLETGYQRELTYRHPDGSYSAFGPSSDNIGSTWLTAFVARSFISAKAFVNIDEKVIEQALEFLAKQQDKDNGGVFEYGRVIHSGMQGGSNSNGVALTAYALLAFIEAKNSQWKKTESNVFGSGNDNSNGNGFHRKRKDTEKALNYTANIDRAVHFILTNTRFNKVEGRAKIDDAYALVLTTYALHMANHPDKDKYFDIMNRLSVEEGTMVYWKNSPKPKPKHNSTTPSDGPQPKGLVVIPPHPWEFTTKPVSVEMTGYALLVYIARGKVAEAFPIVRWLLQQQNSNGGFVSTQDTVVGLTALAKFAELTKETSTELDILAQYEGQEKKVHVSNSTAIVLQEIILPDSTRSVDLKATGRGTVMSQLSWSYYVETQVREPAFLLDVKVTEKKSSLWLKICTSFHQKNASNMAIVEVNLPSGYAVDKDSLLDYLKEVPSYRRYDTENMDSKVEIYLDSIPETPSTCLELLANKVFKVAKKAKSFVTVYDYYDPTRKARTFYDPPSESMCSLCAEGDDCQIKDCP